jgi:S-adenosylmethionine:tRNA ribosyltransferase-isomerase
VRIEELDYPLPGELVAARPPRERDGGRMLVVHAGGIEHRAVRDLAALIPEGAVVVVNDTRVVPARLFGHKEGSGGRVEVLLVERLGAGGERPGERWRAMARAARPLRPGTVVRLGSLGARVEAPSDAAGLVTLDVWSEDDEDVAQVLEREGRVPLPPYLEREDDLDDRSRYQTVYARVPGAVAAPTAGLHLSDELLHELRRRGEVVAVTLHVGPGTFRPITAGDLDDHVMHAERFEVPGDSARAITAARARGRAIVAVGTTVVRALESAVDESGELQATAGETRLLIQPGYRFRSVDALLTNFHLPRSTLLALVYAFGGIDRVRAAYREAVAAGYRFYSYGDAMYLEPVSAPRGGEAA